MRTPAIAFPIVMVTLVACDPQEKKGDPATPSASVTAPKPPPALNPVPVSQFADAGDIDGRTPFEQATEFYATGQLWKARLFLESKALSDGATKPETELLAKICNDQGDDTCVEKCSVKLGKKLKFDAGAVKPIPSGGVEHEEPDSDLARARTLHLKKKDDEAHKLLAPKVATNKASREEIRMLKTICEAQGDEMCVALCAEKLK